jgi:hypothetical protein
MTSKLELDSRIDPRIKAYFAGLDMPVKPDVSSREELLAQENSSESLAALAHETALFDSMDSEEIAPSAVAFLWAPRAAVRPQSGRAESGRRILRGIPLG